MTLMGDHPMGSSARRYAGTSTRRVLIAAVAVVVLVPAAFVGLDAIRGRPVPPSVPAASTTPTGHPPAAPDMAVRAAFGKPITAYDPTGTANAAITVAPLTRRAPSAADRARSHSPTNADTYLVAHVTIVAVAGTWETAGYRMRVDSDGTGVRYVPADAIQLDRGTPLPLATIEEGRSASGEVVFDAPSGRYSFVISVCPAGTPCYDLAMWTTQP